jgi:hypothetical protein
LEHAPREESKHGLRLRVAFRGGRREPPFQGWKTFLRTHAAGITSLDLFVLRTISFKLLYGLVILPHARRRLIAMSVTVPIPLPSDFAGQ